MKSLTSLINRHYLHVYASSRSINTNSCMKLRRDPYRSSPHQRRIPLLSISKSKHFYKKAILYVAERNINVEHFWKTTRSRFFYLNMNYIVITSIREIRSKKRSSQKCPHRRKISDFSLFNYFMHSTLLKIPDIFNVTEWEGMLSSRCILNMKRHAILKYKQRKASKAIHKSTRKFVANIIE